VVKGQANVVLSPQHLRETAAAQHKAAKAKIPVGAKVVQRRLKVKLGHSHHTLAHKIGPDHMLGW